ncbi:hypothetical protein TWF706_004430 [Orbilia oligospora]|uniref:Uncharacterized protein n=1 Tax=Orbilia oligospora TaxID=2813651 RepID=A0A7C8JMZ5_ORBOL|nr:hypothetical protein TWF103_011650 [Orbilia oligospora]KAF3104636.1 hypothetical protein TWF706_004430 [Orbilia oligospora]KAF3121826.1 hypothetical protein TWF703_001621 [Orbilia oligospora]
MAASNTPRYRLQVTGYRYPKLSPTQERMIIIAIIIIMELLSCSCSSAQGSCKSKLRTNDSVTNQIKSNQTRHATHRASLFAARWVCKDNSKGTSWNEIKGRECFIGHFFGIIMIQGAIEVFIT